MQTPPVPAQAEMLLRLYRAMLAAADPHLVIPPNLPPRPSGRTVVVGVGKAAAAMAQAVEGHWGGPLEGVVVVPHGAALPLGRIRVVESSHPVPDEHSVAAATSLLDAVTGLSEDDLVIALISGGGSALCALPASGITLEEKQRITRKLLACGASIHEMNIVRKHLSAIKGGRLAAAAYPARVVSLVISDVPGDDPTQVASGPTLASDSLPQDALAILERYAIGASDTILQGLATNAWGTVRPGDPRLTRNTCRVVASAWDGLVAAARVAADEGLACHILGDALEGEARDLAKAHAGIVECIARHGHPFPAPCVVLSGGEATVTLKSPGRGGRNTEFALALAIALDQPSAAFRVHALSAGTDGLDGKAGAAGAWLTPESLAEARQWGLKPLELLDGNDSASLFDRLGSLVHTGPTHTNINDFRAILIEAP
jgi:glycerate 2-kinase